MMQTDFEKRLERAFALLRRGADPKFSERVMAKLNEAKIVQMRPVEYTLQKLFPYVMAACVLLFLVISVQLLSSGVPSTDMIIGITEITPDDALALIEN
jgi:hypothetical protein